MYEVFYNPLENFTGAIQSDVTMVSGSRTVVITDLEESITYNISVRAFTSAGPGPVSDDRSVMTLQDGKKNFRLTHRLYIQED